jgi:hypothetical protein
MVAPALTSGAPAKKAAAAVAAALQQERSSTASVRLTAVTQALATSTAATRHRTADLAVVVLTHRLVALFEAVTAVAALSSFARPWELQLGVRRGTRSGSSD